MKNRAIYQCYQLKSLPREIPIKHRVYKYFASVTIGSRDRILSGQSKFSKIEQTALSRPEF